MRIGVRPGVRPYVYKGWLGHWFALFPSNERFQFDAWADAVGFALMGRKGL